MTALALIAAGAIAAAPDKPQVRLREHVEVERVLLDARVVDGQGQPLLGLGPADFRVELGGEAVRVESVFWMAGGDAEPPASLGSAPESEAPAAPGRLIVFLFQKDLEVSRIVGLMRMTAEAARLVKALAPGDRAAVLSFDSHLKLWTDFTDDRAKLDRAVRHSILFGARPAPGPIEDGPSLRPQFDTAAARRAASPEKALLLLAEALRELPGAKSLVFVGWGMGRWYPGSGVYLERDYGPAREALLASRTAVFTLDVTNADYHTLEVGLEQVAEDTGGFYAKTHLFTGHALSRLRGALAGHYVLVLEGVPPRAGARRVEIRLVGRSGTVLARPTWEPAH